MSTDQHLNTGAMALGALPDAEAALFVEHLEICPECTAELNGFLETASVLGGSVAHTPPASLRRSVMAAVAQTPQLPPLTLTDSGLGRHRPVVDEPVAAATTSAAVPVAAGPVNAPSTEKLADVIPIRRSWYRRPQALLAAAAAVLVIGGGTTLVVSHQGSTPSQASAIGQCVAAAADKSTISPTVGTGGEVMLVPSCDTAVVKLPHMPDPPSGKVYQLWVVKGTGSSVSTASVGLMQKNADGTFSEVNASVHTGDTAVGVTVEPGPSGSAKPTTKPLWVVPLTV